REIDGDKSQMIGYTIGLYLPKERSDYLPLTPSISTKSNDWLYYWPLSPQRAKRLSPFNSLYLQEN
ncbi:MAG: hypothetical protein IJ417_09350, partial [Bacteroidaceae bacterium]|nr:hypothetical protein [Bacteroidaceae bacterium]